VSKVSTAHHVSTAEKIGVVARVAARQARKNRIVRAVGRAASTTARSAGSALHDLWLEAIGCVFLLMAASGGLAAAHEYAKYSAGKAGFGRVVLAICFATLFAWFGVSSFWRVRRKAKGSAR
jgi:hypothetical protein